MSGRGGTVPCIFTGSSGILYLLLERGGLKLSRRPVIEDSGLDIPVLLQLILHGLAYT